jgi:gamma-glutamyltranspeptidase/glutathione hydrolase
MNKFRKPVGITLLCGLFLLLAASCSDITVATYFEHGAVASEAPIATDIGVEVFRRGGNAVDAAVAVGFGLAVVYPSAGNIGGGGFVVVRDGATATIRTLDFRETAPAAVTETMYLDSTGEVIDRLSTTGARSAGVPGTVAGLYALWRAYGTLPWEDLVRIAADLADTGFIVDQPLAAQFNQSASALLAFPSTAAAFAPEGKVPSVGERLVQPDLARTLYTIAAEGPTGFYEGDIALAVDSTMKATGGLITLEDLAAYTPVWREPISFTFDSLQIFTMAPPSSGGIVLGQMLKLMEPYDFSVMTAASPEYIHLFTETARLAYADRAVHLGDPAFYQVPGSLLDDSYLASRRAGISLETAGSSEQITAGNPPAQESEHTTHFSVCDSTGTMVAITYTLNSEFGSKLVVDGAGFLLNNEMDDFSLKPGHPNLYGLVGGDANKIEPGKRMLSSMTPALVLLHDQPFMILGSKGGSKIITQVAEGIINYTRFGLSLQETTAFPRYHHQWLPDILYLEQGGFDVATMQRLIRYGHVIEERSHYGGLHLIAIDQAGLMQGAVDPRTGGKASGN